MSLFENAYSDQASNIDQRLGEMDANAGDIKRARASLAVAQSSLQEHKEELPINTDEGMGELGLSGVIGAFPSTSAIGMAGKSYLKTGTQKLFKSAIQRAKAKKAQSPEDDADKPSEDIDTGTINTDEDVQNAYSNLSTRLDKLSPEGQESVVDDYSNDLETRPIDEEGATIDEARTNVNSLQNSIKGQEANEGPSLEDRFGEGTEPHPAMDAQGGIPRAPTNAAGEVSGGQGQTGSQLSDDAANFSKQLAKVQGVDTEASDTAAQYGKLAGESTEGLEADEITDAAGSILAESSGILGSIGGAVGSAMGFLGPLGMLAGVGMGIFGAVKEAQAAAQERKVDADYAKAQGQVSSLEATAGAAPSFSVGSMSMPVADSASFRAGMPHF